MARTRTRDERKLAYITAKLYTYSGTFQSQSITGPNGYNGMTSTMVDDSHPGFRNLMKSGQIVMGPMTLSRWNRVTNSNFTTTLSHPYFGKRVLIGDMTGKLYGYATVPSTLLDSKISYLKGNSLVQAYASMNSSSLLVGEVARDLNATLRMLTNPFQGATQLVDQMVKHRRWLLKRRKSMTIAAATTSSWLEYRYGWKPLIMDAGNVVQLATAQSHRSVRRVFRSGGEVSGSTSSKYDWNNIELIPLTQGCGFTMTFKQKARVSSGVIAEFSCSGPSEHWVAGLGLRPRDIVPTVWETIPYSFVADWFVNIGDWLQAITPAPGRTVLGSWTTLVLNCEDHLTNAYCHRWGATAPVGLVTAPLNNSITYRDTVQRWANPSLPTMPSVRPLKISPIHAVDGAALLVQRIVNGLRSWRH